MWRSRGTFVRAIHDTVHARAGQQQEEESGGQAEAEQREGSWQGPPIRTRPPQQPSAWGGPAPQQPYFGLRHPPLNLHMESILQFTSVPLACGTVLGDCVILYGSGPAITCFDMKYQTPLLSCCKFYGTDTDRIHTSCPRKSAPPQMNTVRGIASLS